MTPSIDRPGGPVEVVWIDSTGRGEWHEPDQARELLNQMTCRSVGYLVAEDERGVVIAQGVGGTGGWLSSMAIPRAAIVSIEPLT